MASHMPMYLSMTSEAVSRQFQMEGISGTCQKSVSGNLAQNGHHKSISPRKPYRCMHSALFRKC